MRPPPGADSAYVAMFDEVDEGTAIFKCTSEPPMDPVSKFIGYERLPSDFYLRLTGMGARLMRGEIEPTPEVRARAVRSAAGPAHGMSQRQALVPG